MDSPGTNEAFPQVADLSELAWRATELMSDRRWETVAAELREEYDRDTHWLDEAKDLRKRLQDLWFHLSDIASG